MRTPRSPTIGPRQLALPLSVLLTLGCAPWPPGDAGKSQVFETPGMSVEGRPIRGVDLNRSFPAASWRPHPRHGIEPETRALLKILRQFRPARILAIHSPLYCVNFDGPAEHLAEAMADACGYPIQPSIGHDTPGSLGSYAGTDQEIPTITLELAPQTRRSRIWSEMAVALQRFVTTGPGPGS